MAGKEYRLSIIVTGRDAGASSMLGGIGNSLRSIGTIAGGILTGQLFMNIGRGIGNMAREAIGATGEIQKMNMMLTTLQARELIKSGDFTDMNEALKASAPLAAATMKELERIAVLSPYQLENVNSTYRLAMAFGYTSAEATKFTQATLNMAAGIGAEGEMLDRMSYNLAQVRLQGKVTALDMRQLAMAGFDLGDVLKYVGKQMGVNVEDHNDFNKAIAEGKITWEDFTNHYAEYAEKNFGGASERMSRTLVGLKSTFKDVFALSMPKVLGPAVEVVTGYLNGLLDKFIGLRDSGALEAVGEKLGIFAENAIKTVDKLLVWFDKGRWGKIAEFFGGGFVDLTASFRDSIDNVNWGELSERLISGIQSIDWENLGSNVREGFRNILDGILIIDSEFDFTGVGNALTEGFVDFVGGLFAAGNYESLTRDWTFIGDSISAMFDREGELIKTRWDEFKTTWSFNLSSFGNYVRENFASNLGLSMLGPAGMLASLLPDSAWDEFKTTWAFNLTSMMEWMKTGIVQQGSTLGAAFPMAISGALNSGLSVVAASVGQWALNVVASFAGPFGTLGSILGSAVDAAFSSVASIIAGYAQSIIDILENMVSVVQSTVSAIRTAISGGGGSGSMGTGMGSGAGSGNGGWGGAGGGSSGFSGGGIATGPRSGYQATLHGTEAVIPLEKGNIPVEIKSAPPIQVNVYVDKVTSDIDVREMAYKIASAIAERR